MELITLLSARTRLGGTGLLRGERPHRKPVVEARMQIIDLGSRINLLVYLSRLALEYRCHRCQVGGSPIGDRNDPLPAVDPPLDANHTLALQRFEHNGHRTAIDHKRLGDIEARQRAPGSLQQRKEAILRQRQAGLFACCPGPCAHQGRHDKKKSRWNTVVHPKFAFTRRNAKFGGNRRKRLYGSIDFPRVEAAPYCFAKGAVQVVKRAVDRRNTRIGLAQHSDPPVVGSVRFNEQPCSLELRRSGDYRVFPCDIRSWKIGDPHLAGMRSYRSEHAARKVGKTARPHSSLGHASMQVDDYRNQIRRKRHLLIDHTPPPMIETTKPALEKFYYSQIIWLYPKCRE